MRLLAAFVRSNARQQGWQHQGSGGKGRRQSRRRAKDGGGWIERMRGGGGAPAVRSEEVQKKRGSRKSTCKGPGAHPCSPNVTTPALARKKAAAAAARPGRAGSRATSHCSSVARSSNRATVQHNTSTHLHIYLGVFSQQQSLTKMASRRILSTEKTVLDQDDAPDSGSASQQGPSNIAPAVPSLVPPSHRYISAHKCTITHSPQCCSESQPALSVLRMDPKTNMRALDVQGCYLQAAGLHIRHDHIAYRHLLHDRKHGVQRFVFPLSATKKPPFPISTWILCQSNSGIEQRKRNSVPTDF